jgi:acetyltransferase-like isoleucine patch superfamily enzyme
MQTDPAVAASEQANPAFVHETAIVEDGAALGPGVKIWHFGHVRTGATVGAGTSTGKSVFIDAGVVVGERVKIQNDVFLPHGLTVGDEVFLGPYAVFTNDRHPRASVDWELTPTTVGDGASIAANATVVAGCDIGTYAIVAAGAVVTKPVAPHQIVAGTPARHHGWACICGATVSRTTEPPVGATCSDCERVFPSVPSLTSDGAVASEINGAPPASDLNGAPPAPEPHGDV